MDLASANITPATSYVSFKDDYHFDGQVKIRNGTNHNLATNGRWSDGFIGANIVPGGGKKIFQVRMERVFADEHGLV